MDHHLVLFKIEYKLQPLLHCSVRKNSLTELKNALSLGIDVDSKDSKGCTALHLAAIQNLGESHCRIMKELLKNGADVNALDNEGKTPIQHLLKNKVCSLKTIELLVKSGAVINVRDHLVNITLRNAIILDDYQMVKLFLDHGSDVNVYSFRFTLLHWACRWSNGEIVKLLVKKGADVNALDCDGCTPLMRILANQRASEDSVQYLLKYSDVNVVDAIGRNVVNVANSVGCLEILLQHIAKLQALDLWVDPYILETISSCKISSFHFARFTNELEVAKKTRLQHCWVTIFNLLVDSGRKLKNYGGNEDLIKAFSKSQCRSKFPVNGAEICRRVFKGIKKRKYFDISATTFSYKLPIFNRMHLIVRDTLDCLTYKDTEIFVSKF